MNPDVMPETLSDPISDNSVQTKGGYWLIKVVDKADNRQLDSTDRNSLIITAFNNWASSLWTIASVNMDDSYLTADRKTWAAQQAAKP